MLTTASFLALLKEMYVSDRIVSQVLKNSALLAAIQKKHCGGKHIVQPIVYGAVQNRSANYSKSKAGTDTSKQTDFIYDIATNFQNITIDHVAMKRAEKDATAFKQALSHEMELGTSAFSRDISLNLFLKSDGVIGKIGAVAGNVITLSVPSDIVRFEVGMVIAPDAVAGGVAEAKATMKVVARSDEKGQITVDAIGTAEVGDFLHVDGDQDSKMQGLSDWLPFGAGRDAALAAVFNGVQRSVDSTRLAGIYLDAQRMTIQMALRKAKAMCKLFGIGEPNFIVMNPMDLYSLENELEGRAIADVFNVKTGSITIGFDAIRLGSISGGAKIVADVGCPKGVAYMLTLSTWTYWHLGQKFMNTWNEDGQSLVRTDDNGLTAQMYSYGNIGCSSPAANAVIWLGDRDIG